MPMGRGYPPTWVQAGCKCVWHVRHGDAQPVAVSCALNVSPCWRPSDINHVSPVPLSEEFGVLVSSGWLRGWANIAVTSRTTWHVRRCCSLTCSNLQQWWLGHSPAIKAGPHWFEMARFPRGLHYSFCDGIRKRKSLLKRAGFANGIQADGFQDRKRLVNYESALDSMDSLL
jgi:hypothetical protein